MDKLIETLHKLSDKNPIIIKRINFPLPIPSHENFINFCGSSYKNDFLKYYDISLNETNLKLIDKFFNGGKLINDYLNNLKKKLINSNYHSLDDLWDYITILNYSRKIFLNNNSNFQYTQNDEIISSSSLDFEYCMSLYIMASKQQTLFLLNENDKLEDSKQLKEKVKHLIISERCFEEAFLIAKTIENNNNIIIIQQQKEEELENEEKIEPFKIFSNNPKRYIINIETQGMGSEDVNNILIKSNTTILGKWVNDIGGLDLMKTRSKIAYCQANEFYFKSIKYFILQNPEVPKSVLSSISYAIGLCYQSIFNNNNNGPLNNEKYDENFNKIFSKFMSKYWFLKSHYITFINNTEQFIKEDSDTQEFIENSLNNKNIIDNEFSRFKKIKKYQNVLTKLNNDNIFNTFIQKSSKKFEIIETIFKKFSLKIDELSLSIDDNIKISKNIITPVYCQNISKTIQFNDYINISLQRILKKNRDFQFFFNFTDNKIINLNDLSSSPKPDLSNTSHIFNGNLLLKLKDYQDIWIEHERNTLLNSYDKELFSKGRIHERLSWIHFFINLLKANQTFTDDNNSIKYIENTIQEFINIVDQF